jgi:hypothetical protein
VNVHQSKNAEWRQRRRSEKWEIKLNFRFRTWIKISLSIPSFDPCNLKIDIRV